MARRADLEAHAVALRGDMAELSAELKGDMTELRAELKGEMTELRGDMAMLSARIEGLLPRQLLADVPLAFAVAGLVLVAAKLA